MAWEIKRNPFFTFNITINGTDNHIQRRDDNNAFDVSQQRTNAPNAINKIK